MMALSLAVVVILILLAAYMWQRFVKFFKFTRTVMKLPSNKPFPILGHAFTFMGDRSHIWKKVFDIVHQNGPLFVFWFGPRPLLILTKPHHIQIILGNRKNIQKTFPYSFFNLCARLGLVTLSGDLWRIHRKLITPSFHFSILEKFVDVFVEKSQILVKRLHKKIGSENWDIVPYVKTCTLETILETAMGIQHDTEAAKEDGEFLEASQNFTVEITERVRSLWLHPEFLYLLSPSGRRFKKCARTLHRYTEKVIKKRKELFKLRSQSTPTDENDTGRREKLNFLDLLIETSQNSGLLTDEEIRDEVSTFIFAGYDSTTSALSWCLQMLAIHPEVQERACEELDSIFHASFRSPTTKDLNEMTYLERVIRETLRLYSIVPLIGRDTQEDIEIDGHSIPAGMKVIVLIMALHRDPELYPDPEKFNPDNFLPEKVATRHPYAYLPFCAGPRNCIGQKFAMLEMKVILSYILRHYKLEPDGEVPTPLIEIVVRPQNGIKIKITPRVTSI